MKTEYLGGPYHVLGYRLDDGRLMLAGWVNAPYEPQSDDLYLPDVGGGVLVADGLRDAILDGSFTGRFVPYRMAEPGTQLIEGEITQNDNAA